MGYAILFDATETFDSMMTGDQLFNPTNGLGILSDAISCYVEEERNSFFELEMEYPAKGIHAEKLQLERLIVAKPNALSETWQAFRIYRMVKTLDGIIHIYARHISYALSGMEFLDQPLLCGWYIYVYQNGSAPSSWYDFPQPFLTDEQAGYNVANILTLMNRSLSEYYGDKFSAVIGNDFSDGRVKNMRLNDGKKEINSVRYFMQGSEGSVIDIWGGTWLWNNFCATLRKSRASLNSGNVTARYGFNLTELEYDISSEDTYSTYVPFVIGGPDNDEIVYYTSPISIDDDDIPDWLDKTYFLDCTDLLSQDELDAGDLRHISERAESKIKQLNIGKVPVNTTFKYEALSGYDVGIDDVINVIYEPMNLQYSTKVVRVKYDVIRERTEEIETGTHTQTFKWSELLKK